MKKGVKKEAAKNLSLPTQISVNDLSKQISKEVKSKIETKIKKGKLYIGDLKKTINPFSGLVSGNFWAQTGMPWVSTDGRKAVLTEWFWQPIRGQPRRVDTNELRKFSQSFWVNVCVNTIIDQITSFEWDIVRKEGIPENPETQAHIDEAKDFFKNPNMNSENFNMIQRAFLRDVKEIDAGVVVKVFTKDSYDFEQLEPKSGAPMLKPRICPECGGTAETGYNHARDRIAEMSANIQNNIRKWQGHKIISEKESVLRKTKSGRQAKVKYILDYDSVWKDYYEKAIEKIDDIKKSIADMDIEKSLVNQDKRDVNVSCPFCNGTGRGRQMTELYARDGASFLKETDKFGFVRGYWQYSYQIPAHPMWFNRDEIVYMAEHPRSMSPYGYAGTQAILDIIKSLHHSTLWNKNFFEESSIPDGIISLPETSSEEMQRFNQMWNSEMAARPHKLAVVNAAVDFKQMMISQRELEFLETQRWYMKLVISQYKLTPEELGFTEDANRAVAANASEVFRRKGIRPLVAMMEYLWNTEVVSEFGYDDIDFKYIIKDPIEQKMRIEVAKMELESGIKTINEVRKDMGLEPFPDETFNYPMTMRQQSYSIGGLQPAKDGKDRSMDEDSKVREQVMRLPQEREVGGGNISRIGPYGTSLENVHAPQAKSADLLQGAHAEENNPTAKPDGKTPEQRYPFAQEDARCPYCGSNIIHFIGSDLNGRQDNWRCANCKSEFIVTNGKLMPVENPTFNNVPMLGPAGEGQRAQNDIAVTKPEWSPKKKTVIKKLGKDTYEIKEVMQ